MSGTLSLATPPVRGERSAPKRALRVLALLVGVALAAAALTAPAAPAEAANPSDGFQPGNIISDANFYDGTSMTVDEVQGFLNRQVPSCWLGRPGYEVGKPVQWGGPTKLASKCLKDFRINTTTQQANAYCSGVPGVNNESAASVIVRVGKACGISPKVLLVMLDKEQSLVSDPWPNENQYFLAMGYACPDSGPGNSANCDPALGGFAKQVYRAAWQYKVYKAFPNSYRYRPFETGPIQWHPNQGCGTSQVKIENYATAGLYIYTPYRPNQAALTAGWGTGDACSTYGNRNFYNYYKAWFGPPVLSLDHRFSSLFEELKGSLGGISSGAIATGAGIRQELERGTMYWSASTGAAVVAGGIRTSYDARGGALGYLGFPLAREQKSGEGVVQQFSRANIYWHRSRGTYAVAAGIRTYFEAAGGVARFGFPLGDETGIPGGGANQEFERGVVTWGPAGVGAYSVHAGMLQTFRSLGGAPAVGYALALEQPKAGGSSQRFKNMDIHWTSGSGGIPVYGGVRNAFVRFGGVDVSGYARSREQAGVEGSYYQEFQNYVLYWSKAGGEAALLPDVHEQFLLKGFGAVGLPVGQTSVLGAGHSQEFTKGTLLGSSESDYWLVSGGIRNSFSRAGGYDALGLPVTSETRQGDGSARQDFTNGIIVWSSVGGGNPITGGILEYYTGPLGGNLGVPMGASVSIPGGRTQRFMHGTLYESPSRGTHLVAGGISTAYERLGSTAALGFPTGGEARQEDGSVIQEFERGKIRWTSSTGGLLLP